MTRTSCPGKGWTKTKTPERGQKGFTLFEMIIVVVLMGTLAGLVLPAASGVLSRVNQQSSVREVTSAMRYARSKAVTAKVPVAFQAEFAKNRYWLEDLQSGKVSKVRELQPEIVFREYDNGEDTVTDGTFTIIYYPRGNTSGGAVRLSAPREDDEREWFEIAIDPVTGKSKVTRDPFNPEKEES